jgi:PhzF family phenazine biosynthesis protein
MIEARFEEAFKAWMMEQGDALFEEAQQVEIQAEHDGLVYRNKAFPLPPRLTLLSDEQRDDLVDAGEALLRVLEKVIRLYEQDPETRRYFMLEPGWEELALIDPGYQRRIRISRFDTYLTRGPERFKILENNTDCPAGVIFTGRVNDIMKRVPAFARFLSTFPPVRSEGIDGPEAFFDELVRAYRELFGPRDPAGVAILQPRGRASVESQEMVKLLSRRGWFAVVCDPRDMEYARGHLFVQGRTVDLVWNKINTADFVPLLREPDRPRDFLSACRDRAICQVNSFGARFVTESKLCLAYLRDPEFAGHFSPAERALIERHVPWSRRLVGNPEVRFDGQIWPLRELALARREHLVLKAAYDIRGDGVTVGRGVAPDDWRAQLESAWDRPFILQEFVTPQQIEVPLRGSPIAWQAQNFSVDLFMAGGRFMGFGSKLSPHLKVNVFQGGSKQALLSVTDPRALTGQRIAVFGSQRAAGSPTLVVRRETVDATALRDLARRHRALVVQLRSSERADVRMAVFTPAGERPCSAQGVLAGAFAFAWERRCAQLSVETAAGIIRVQVREARDDRWVELQAPLSLRTWSGPAERGPLLHLLGLADEALDPEAPFCVASVGEPALLVPLAGRAALRHLQPRLPELSAWLERHELPGIFCYWLADEPGRVEARHFDPRCGLDEGGSGLAAGALAALLAEKRRGPLALQVETGWQDANECGHGLVQVSVDPRGVFIGGMVAPLGRFRFEGGPIA